MDDEQLRIHFAGLALAGLIASGKTVEPFGHGPETDPTRAARRAWAYADAMIAERWHAEKTPEVPKPPEAEVPF